MSLYYRILNSGDRKQALLYVDSTRDFEEADQWYVIFEKINGEWIEVVKHLVGIS